MHHRKPWDLRDFVSRRKGLWPFRFLGTEFASTQVPKQLHITPLKPDPYPAYFRGPVLNTKAAVNFVLSDLWYVGELEKSAAMEARYRATLEETRRRTEQSRQQAGSSFDVQKGVVSRPPPPESPVQKRLRNRPRLCTTGSWAQSLKGMKMPKFFLTITGQLTALGLGEFQGQQHSGIDVRERCVCNSLTALTEVLPCAGCAEYRESSHGTCEKGRLARYQRKVVPSTKMQLDGKARSSVLESQDLAGMNKAGKPCSVKSYLVYT